MRQPGLSSGDVLSLSIYGYATGTFSVRKIERAKFDSLALRHVACNRHSALSYEHAMKSDAYVKAEVQELLALAEGADQSSVPDGVSLPDDVKRREDLPAASRRRRSSPVPARTTRST